MNPGDGGLYSRVLKVPLSVFSLSLDASFSLQSFVSLRHGRAVPKGPRTRESTFVFWDRPRVLLPMVRNFLSFGSVFRPGAGRARLPPSPRAGA